MKNNFILKSVLIFTLLFLPITSIIIINDPGYFFTSFKETNYCNSKENLDRYIIPSVIRKTPHETVIIGDSLASELHTEIINSKLNTISVNSCQRGSQLYEQQNLINYEIKVNKNLKKIIWVIRNSLLIEKNPKSIYSEKAYPWYLYSNNFNKNLYYFDANLLHFNSKKDRAFITTDFNYYDNDFFIQRQNTQLEDYFNTPKTISSIQSLEVIDPDFQNNLFQNIIKTVNKIPENIEVIIVFPPVRIRYFYHLDIRQIIACQNYLVEKLSQKPNIHFVDYTIEDSISHKAEYFFDHIHFSPEIGQFMVENIDNPKYHVTNENLDSFNQNFINQVNNFNKLTEEEILNY